MIPSTIQKELFDKPSDDRINDVADAIINQLIEMTLIEMGFVGSDIRKLFEQLIFKMSFLNATNQTDGVYIKNSLAK